MRTQCNARSLTDYGPGKYALKDLIRAGNGLQSMVLLIIVVISTSTFPILKIVHNWFYKRISLKYLKRHELYYPSNSEEVVCVQTFQH